MIKKIGLCLWALWMSGCTTADITNVARIATSKDPSAAAKIFASTKSVQYATNPQRLEKDLQDIETGIGKLFVALAQAVGQKWGEENVKESSKTEVVKYLQDYQSRALIDFDKGIVTVETVAEKEVQKQLEEAIITTLLLPNDPRQVDLFTSQKVKLGDTPYLFNEVVDDQGKAIRWQWRASRYAKLLIRQKMRQKNITKAGQSLKVYSVSFPMVKDHASVRVAKFKPLVKKYAARYKLSENLIYAIIRTESNFNQFAISRTGAVGLMQVMPSTAGKDAYAFVTGKTWKPTRSYLFDASQNMELGSAYLQLLKTRYLSGISHDLSMEYCMISSYNGGAGLVLRTFDKDRANAKKRVNSLTPSSVYETLITKVPAKETRNYLKKVLLYKKDFIRL